MTSVSVLALSHLSPSRPDTKQGSDATESMKKIALSLHAGMVWALSQVLKQMAAFVYMRLFE